MPTLLNARPFVVQPVPRVLLWAVAAMLTVGALPSARAQDGLQNRDGLLLWLDATESLKSVEAGKAISEFPDLSGSDRTLRQNDALKQPKVVRVAEKSLLRFDGDNDHLRLESTGLSAESVTLVMVAAPHLNPGDFRGFFATNEPERRDYESGLTLDLGPGPSRSFDQVNLEGKGFGGAADVLNSSSPFGTLHVFVATINPADGLVHLSVDGKDEGQRALKPGKLSLEQITLGARFYTNGPGAQEVRGPFQGDIAEVLLFDRVLSKDESARLTDTLLKKYAAVREELPKTLNLSATMGVPLELAKDAPPVQMLVPGFDIDELPVEITNVNNVRYRNDGVLVTLGYNGDIHLLTDSNGDGIEDQKKIFYQNRGSLRGPIGMELTPPGYSKGRGAFIASKGKVSLIVDTNGDDVADDEIIVATGWQEITQNVDATGMAIGPDGSLYFGLGTANYANAYLIDEAGKAAYSLTSDRGTVQKVSPDFSKRETICTGTRFPIAFAFNENGDLFCTEQEGATWMPNGNPLDELLHIRLNEPKHEANVTGKRHYGFPPRHPVHNPGVIDEPSTFDFGPQHQSTCGMVFNRSVNGGPIFGPDSWKEDALICGESRGKIWRTSLVKTPTGYVASSQLIACLSMLTVDNCVSPRGDLIIACHSGPPDWGTGPTGIGKLYRVRMVAPEAPRPVIAWAESPQEIRITFDRPVDPMSVAGLVEKTRIEYGEHVRAGDRFETMVPPYAVVRAQQMKPRFVLPVASAALTADQRTIVLNTPPMPKNTHFAVSLPYVDASAGRVTRNEADTKVAAATASLPKQHPHIDVDLTTDGLQAAWIAKGQEAAAWAGWLPHADLAVSGKFTHGSVAHEELWKKLDQSGVLLMRTRLDLRQMLRPAVQPGASIDYQWPDETVTLVIHSASPLAFHARSIQPDGKAIDLAPLCTQNTDGSSTIRLTTTANIADLIEASFEMETGKGRPEISVGFFTNEDASIRPLPLHRFKLPWVALQPAETESSSPPAVAELEGGSWGRGRRVFHSEAAGCSKCHAVNGGGATIGPDLGNLVFRDYASVLRDVKNPSFAINPDYIGHIVEMSDGKVLTGVLQTREGKLWLGDALGKQTEIDRAEIETLKPSQVSVMPQGIVDKLTPEQLKDLLTFLLTPPPKMPLDSPLTAPPLRTQAEVAAALEGSQPVTSLRPLHIILIDGVKDHGPGEHDYPAWRSAWEQLLSSGEQVQVTAVREFPDAEQLKTADVLIFFQKGSFNAPRPEKLDAFLKRGGGAVYIHWAVNGDDRADQFAQRIGLASKGGAIAYRHGPLTLDIHNTDHPIVRNFDRLQMYDESYWKLSGDPQDVTLLATSTEDGQPTPQMWVRDHRPGRVFVSIPGHYSWSFDDPLFRILLLRGIAWTANEPVDRFNDLVTPGARIRR